MKHQNYVLVDSAKTLSKLIEICKIYNVKFFDQDDYPTYKMFGKRLKGGYWLSAEYTGVPIPISEFVAHLESEEKPTSILDGKCAIQVNNEREFRLLMEHYESKGWETFTGMKVSEIKNIWCKRFPCFLTYCNEFESYYRTEPFKSIPFTDFSKEVGINPPVFIMNSEDGVDLYEGDLHYPIYLLSNGKWNLDIQCILLKNGDNKNIPYNTASVFTDDPNNFKAFSTKESAEKWILKANKPEMISFCEEHSSPIEVFNDSLRIKCKGSKHTENVILNSTEIEKIIKAYQSLQ